MIILFGSLAAIFGLLSIYLIYKLNETEDKLHLLSNKVIQRDSVITDIFKMLDGQSKVSISGYQLAEHLAIEANNIELHEFISDQILRLKNTKERYYETWMYINEHGSLSLKDIDFGEEATA